MPAGDAETGFEVVRRLLAEAEAAVAASVRAPGDGDQPAPSELVQRRLLALLYGLEATLPPDPERRTLFALAAIADEWLLNRAPWPGQAAWPSLLLEEALFGTRVAGERVFLLADAAMRSPPGLDRTLAAVLLTGFLLGFEGRYRGAVATERLALYREGLYRTVFGRPVDPSGELGGLLPVPRPAVAPETPVRTLPSLRPWVAAAIVLVLAYFVGAHLIWSSGVRPLLALSSHIVDLGSAPGVGLVDEAP
ncbi:MAG: DotU family type IV/VI secretion system protein [Alphaproteobacteria bacterium]